MDDHDTDHGTPELGGLPERLYGAWWPEGEQPPVRWDDLEDSDRVRFQAAARVIFDDAVDKAADAAWYAANSHPGEP